MKLQIKIGFGNSGEVLSKLKCRGFRATTLYEYTILPHNLIKKRQTTRFDRED